MISALVIIIFLLGLCWGSFLNVVTYRIIFDKPFFTMRSYCYSCGKKIFWYDNIPVISWFVLKGKCRNCQKKISILYPIFEILTGIMFSALFMHIFFPNKFGVILVEDNFSICDYCPLFFTYLLFFSALIASSNSDLRILAIPQVFTIWLAPVGIFLSWIDVTVVSLTSSICGAVLGYTTLFVVEFLFHKITKKKGLGIGDMELLCMIGAFLGPSGVWFSLMIGSLLGLAATGTYLLITKKNKDTQIPYGPFLSLGASIFFFFKDNFVRFLFYLS